MEFGEKLQLLRKQRGLTQEELAEALFVSRTAVSKWESGRGYPSIDSLKAVAGFFSVSVDELLSGSELMAAAESDRQQSAERTRSLIFGLLDCSVVLFLFLPLFGQRAGAVIESVSLPALTGAPVYVMIPYYLLVAFTAVWGVAQLAMQGRGGERWPRLSSPASAALSVLSTLMFIASSQPYAATFTLMFLLIKGFLLIKKP